MFTNMISTTYSEAILSAFDYLLKNYPEVFVLGQGLWSPWYVGNTMKNLDKKYGKDRIIDTPVSESACTGAAVGASICGMKPIIVHPRMDFMLYAMDSIVNQAAKWSYMFGGQLNAPVTIRSIINRGGSQGAQHSQALHSWFAHIPGIRVVMPSTVEDARDLLISSVLCPDPVIYIDDRWLYEQTAYLKPIKETPLNAVAPKCLKEGDHITIVGSGYSTLLALNASKKLNSDGVSAEVFDLRVLNPFNSMNILDSVLKTKRLLVIDSGWKSCGMASEVITSIVEHIPANTLIDPPRRITLPDCPAPSSEVHEQDYYPNEEKIIKFINHEYYF
jgi:pyruvate dehydrogenase E1 component beta subunit